MKWPKTNQFNFVGKLLGPKGNSMKRLQEETMCKMAVLGRGSMKDRKKVYVITIIHGLIHFKMHFYIDYFRE